MVLILVFDASRGLNGVSQLPALSMHARVSCSYAKRGKQKRSSVMVYTLIKLPDLWYSRVTVGNSGAVRLVKHLIENERLSFMFRDAYQLERYTTITD